MNKICTDINQSKKLIELGIDVDTSDMVYIKSYFLDEEEEEYNLLVGSYHEGYAEKDDGSLIPLFDEHIPAWSLSALLELIPPYLGEFKDGINFGFSKAMNCKWYSAHYIKLDNTGLATFTKTVTGDTAIDAAFEMIVWLKENKKI